MAGAADELRFLAAAMRRAGSRDVLAELRDGLKKAAEPAAQDARRSILAMPATREAGLRRGIAGTVKVTASLGASSTRVVISATGPERWRGAAADIERGSWNHPVFGHAEAEAASVALQQVHGSGHGHGRGWRWVRQHGKEGWFSRAVAAHQAGFDRAVDQVTDRIERRLAGEA